MQNTDEKEWGLFFVGLGKLPRRLVTLFGNSFRLVRDICVTFRFRKLRNGVGIVLVVGAAAYWGLPAFYRWRTRPLARKPVFYAPVVATLSVSDPGYGTLGGEASVFVEEWGVFLSRLPYDHNGRSTPAPFLRMAKNRQIMERMQEVPDSESFDSGQTGMSLKYRRAAGNDVFPNHEDEELKVHFRGYSEITDVNEPGGDFPLFPTRWITKKSVNFRGRLKVFSGEDLLVEQACDWVDPMVGKARRLYNGKYVLFCDFPYFEWGKDGKPYYHFYVIQVPDPPILSADETGSLVVYKKPLKKK